MIYSRLSSLRHCAQKQKNNTYNATKNLDFFKEIHFLFRLCKPTTVSKFKNLILSTSKTGLDKGETTISKKIVQSSSNLDYFRHHTPHPNPSHNEEDRDLLLDLFLLNQYPNQKV